MKRLHLMSREALADFTAVAVSKINRKWRKTWKRKAVKEGRKMESSDVDDWGETLMSRDMENAQWKEKLILKTQIQPIEALICDRMILY